MAKKKKEQAVQEEPTKTVKTAAEENLPRKRRRKPKPKSRVNNRPSRKRKPSRNASHVNRR